ncbi:four helix bundle protein [Candidatus Gracilibacteria bacterium]|nr:four helix bundle protein [Candidatus Gracilibacteria bacterium]MCF7897090.1 four helix bundle protein [Candidatus Gracilibacteria bacterium]
MQNIDIQDRAKKFAVRVIRMVRALPKEGASFVIGKQVIRSATSIGANLVEGGGGATKKDFINFMNIARKSALETRYWLELIIAADLLKEGKLKELLCEIEEIIKILTRIILNSKK